MHLTTLPHQHQKWRIRQLMRWSKVIGVAASCLVLSFMTVGCASGKKTILDPKKPTVVTVWHAYNAFAKTVFDNKVTEFNETTGMELGIVVDAYGYGSSGELDEALFNSANKIIGSEPLPDIFTAYPDSAYRLDRLAPLVELTRYFSEEELSEYRPEFLKEGVWGSGAAPKLIPVSKSTELLYVNETYWKRFAEETGLSDEMLTTWEGLAAAAERYYEWTGGRPFLGMNAFNDFAVLTAVQSGTEPFVEEDGTVRFSYPKETARRVWEAYYVPHINGWYKSGVYNQDGVKSGNLIAYIGSSAGAAYFPDEVIVDEEKRYPVECRVMAYPTFKDGQDYMTQRGADMGIFSTDQAHEYAAAEFLKWFTDPVQNIDFTISIGYIPVEQAALSSSGNLETFVQESDNAVAVKKSVKAVLEAMDEGKFYVRKTFEHSYDADEIFSLSLNNKVELDLADLTARIEHGEDREAVIAELTGEENFEEWYRGLTAEIEEALNE